MDPRHDDHLRFVWTVFPGVDLVAHKSFEMVTVFYMLGPGDIPLACVQRLIDRRDRRIGM
ncbi:hypothetical protein [Polyangium sp. 15x6]|uniref:hypothetical protein n=1 Tax=Polyangium sp. 15x6 TaxID=3042687 RepID=UPI00249AD92A|nr:hypothetical protein [Polyangium sp. 15x6]MDI3291616.1 hypothetical protein [Polyangium sp. 15x6]